MIFKFRKVSGNLYRGGAPTPDDVKDLHQKYQIERIISLDALAGIKIKEACHDFGIEHQMLPIDGSLQSMLNLLKVNYQEIDAVPTFVHCHAGKDRTGLFCALFRINHGWSPEKALQEAKSLGFGVALPKIYLERLNRCFNLYPKLLKDTNDDLNQAYDGTIQDKMRGYNYLGEVLDSDMVWHLNQDSWAEYIDPSTEAVSRRPDNSVNTQFPTRQNYSEYKQLKDMLEEAKNSGEEYQDEAPQVGVYNNDAHPTAFGPTEVGGWFCF